MGSKTAWYQTFMANSYIQTLTATIQQCGRICDPTKLIGYDECESYFWKETDSIENGIMKISAGILEQSFYTDD